MSKVIEFPSKEKRIERFLREQLPLEMPAEELAALASELQQVAERIEGRSQSFQLLFPQSCSQGEMEFVTRQVEEMVRELMRVIKDEEGEIFSLIVRYHLLLHEARQLADRE